MNGTITKLERQKKKDNRISIFIDDEFAFGVQGIIIDKFGLHVGKILSEEECEHIQNEENFLYGKTAALKLISRRLRSKGEIKTFLKRKDLTEDTIERVLDSLSEEGYLNDERFAEAFIHDRLARKTVGRRILEQELRMRGIEKEIIAKLLTSRSLEDELNAAMKAAGKKLGSLGRFDKKAQHAKLWRFLQSRGFSSEVISKAVQNSESINS